MSDLERIEREISCWPQVSVHPHRFGGLEFRFGAAEIGHVHRGGIIDIPFTRSIHDALLSEGMAEEHHWVPKSGWITFRIRHPQELSHAIWLLRLSYLRFLLKTTDHPQKMLQKEAEELRLSARFKALLEVFIPEPAKEASAERMPA